jgi:RNA polymerase sigma-70 factor (ECF subfamily)
MKSNLSTEENKKEDYALIDNALAGDQSAYSRIMEKYNQVVGIVIQKVIHNQVEIDDLKQEVFIKAFNSLHTFKREYAFSTWLFRIATNHSIDFLRKKRLKAQSMQESIETQNGELKYQYASKEATPERKLIEREARVHITRAIENLPQKYRICIEMRHKEEKSYEEIAEELNIPIGTVKARIFRARELLNKELKEILTDR